MGEMAKRVTGPIDTTQQFCWTHNTSNKYKHTEHLNKSAARISIAIESIIAAAVAFKLIFLEKEEK